MYDQENLVTSSADRCRVLWEIGIEEHDGDVRFYTGSENMAVSPMRNEKYAI